MSEPSKQIECSLCHRKPKMEGLEVCSVCMGYDKEDVVLQPSPIPVPVVPMWTCNKCGDLFEQYKNGRSIVTAICSRCLYQKRRKTIKETLRRTRTGYSIKFISDDEKSCTVSNPLVITLDFSRCPWALEWLKYKNDGHGLENNMVRQIAEQVSSDWLKDYMINRVLK